MATKKIAVVGSIVIDEVQGTSGDLGAFWGGITYSLLALARLAGDCRVVPISWLGRSARSGFAEAMAAFPQIDCSALLPAESLARASLVVRTPGGEVEYVSCSPAAPPLPWSALEPHLDADAWLIVWRTPQDLGLESLRRIRVASKGVVHLDLHGLLRAPSPGPRAFRRLENWRSYVAGADVVQVDEEELCHLLGEESRDLAGAARAILGEVVRYAVVTAGEEGSCLFWLEEGRLRALEFDAPAVRASDPTGCSDVFGAAFLATFLESGDPIAASEVANREAARNAALIGSGVRVTR